MAARGDDQQEDRAGSGDGADRHAEGFEQEEAGEQQREDDPARPEGGGVADRVSGRAELRHVIAGRYVAPEEQQQRDQRRGDRRQIDRHHHRRIIGEADLEEVGRHDVDEVGDDQRQAGGVGDEPRRHDERQRRLVLEAQRPQHRDDDRRQDQRRAIVGEQRRHRRAEQHDQHEQPATMPPAPARDVQRRPFEEPGFIEQQADDDDRDERRGRVPDDAPHHRHVGERDDPASSATAAPPIALHPMPRPLGCQMTSAIVATKISERKQHQATRWPEASTTCSPSSFANAPC